MSLTYILIDFENVQPEVADWKLVGGNDDRVLIFHGSHQDKFDYEMVTALQPLGDRVEYIRCERRGKNALDFRMAFQLGKLVQALSSVPLSKKEKAAFAVVSKDKDLDRLLEHIQALGFRAGRGPGIQAALAFEIPTVVRGEAPPESSSANATPNDTVAVPIEPVASTRSKDTKPPVPLSAPTKTQDTWSRIVEHLRDHPKNRPTTPAALERHLKTLLGVDATEAGAKDLAAKLVAKGLVVLKDKKLGYVFPKNS